MGTTEKLIVTRIIDLLVSGNYKEDEIIDIVEKEFKIPNEEIPYVIELIKTGLFRALIISKGTRYPESNSSKNDIVILAQKIGLKKLLPKKGPWWQFWKS